MDLLDKIIQRHHQLEGSRPATGREGMLNTLKQKVSASAKQHALSLTDFTSVKEPASDIEVPDPLRFSGMTNAYANAAYLMKAKM